MDEDFDDPTDFANPAFEGVDEHLRCPICSEFFQTAMILKTCSHTFCSLCIRRSLTVEQCCPSCRTHSVETSLHNNYVVDNLVSVWKNNRKSILDLEGQLKQANERDKNAVTMSDSPMDTSLSQPTDGDERSPPARQTRSSSRRSASQTSAEAPPPVPEDTRVDCHICHRKIDLNHLNQHWDLCEQGKPDPSLDKPSSTSSSPSPSAKKPVMFGVHQPSTSKSLTRMKKAVDLGKKPQKIVYNLETPVGLRKVLRELGLPDKGDKSTLIKRHKEWISLYNANVDSTDPVDVKVLRKRLLEQEGRLAIVTEEKINQDGIEQHRFGIRQLD
ncbi:hypothetical protein K450DRAFT_241636 [Umbelopsis ramanniana AG]|uniref:Postreplication repair E3 ubiquitin-protein ligase RAD18 n=1 Tax=Umbelopsis ramanniana AG TaxID=1314678 RepID=A0AAD5HF13_UMBRA|nr:uncharacterized protein K450DRAFT_241636 [Umbelopsis ramanniana AG]KAI8579573.1 hypothetical protein K450DRAFT_241636 [Umbelopsis ramanniana AG]